MQRHFTLSLYMKIWPCFDFSLLNLFVEYSSKNMKGKYTHRPPSAQSAHTGYDAGPSYQSRNQPQSQSMLSTASSSSNTANEISAMKSMVPAIDFDLSALSIPWDIPHIDKVDFSELDNPSVPETVTRLYFIRPKNGYDDDQTSCIYEKLSSIVGRRSILMAPVGDAGGIDFWKADLTKTQVTQVRNIAEVASVDLDS
ncbi:uncharacterized protein BCR38DRAFT_519407 [Pseudomassariella vexata]|uniref:Uncharacterized protein n=1 Tax=Pseudomassariella vexata TaxID=1141098 RepID=A0A1Y2EH43_9PEZI|nr:uncharacterized protein BCR38DRAFT_519407 [Pseudomassariella vexata]ORY70889.1 hypothetical protein BCR38DRAFT_519407 [Pseudomassariella vexata]